MENNSSPRQSRVPTSRFGRLARLGYTAGEMAVGGLTEGLKRAAGKNSGSQASMFLTPGNAKKLARRLAGMRGAAMKMGQILSMEGSDIVPPEFAGALAILRDAANTMPDSQIRRVLGREYGKGWEKRFSHFDFQPIAAASIGQVHRAVTVDGRELALKIQYPGVARSINSDVDNLAMFLRMANLLPVDLDVSGIIDEAKRQLKQEADYLQEASWLRTYRDLVKDDPHFVVPDMHEDLTTRRILAMDYVEGVSLESLADKDVPQTVRDRVATQLEQLMFRELFEFRTMQTDPNFGNYMFQPESGRIVLLDFGSTASFKPVFVENYRDIAKAIIEDDHDAILQGAEKIGYVDENASPAHAWRMMEMIRMAGEPLRGDGPYDFARSDISVRARDAGMDMALKSRKGDLKSPPPETVFLHRKLAGSFLLSARLGARVNVREIILGHLD